MRFALAVALVSGFLLLGVYWRINGHERLYWLAMAAAVISPWFCGMQIGGGANPDEGDEDVKDDMETR